MKNLFIIIFILCSIFFVQYSSRVVRALECGEDIPEDTPEGVLRDYMTSCNKKIQDNKGQQATLSAAINYFNGQIGLTQAQIATTQKELDKLNVEIADLSGKISTINVSLDDLTRFFISRVRETYKGKDALPFTFILSQGGFGDFVRQVEYLKRVRDHDKDILLSLEKSRLDLSSQKTQKETKQAEVESLKKKLSAQKASLSSQKSVKDQLLAETKNDEKRYQSLRSEAASRVAQLANYTSSRGGSSLLSGTTKCDDWGCYYNQRDREWGGKLIGSSNMTMASVGCLVTSAAMVASHYGKSLTPADIAGSTNPFEYDTADMRFTWLGSVNGTTVTRTSIGCSGSGCFSAIDSEINAGRPVIVRITAASVAGTHFIVITKKEGDNYIMKDPYEADGNNIPFTSKHSISAITRVDKVSVQ